jgi:tetratricopeptide (TPR) repeat protein
LPRLPSLEGEPPGLETGDLQPLLAGDPPGNLGVHLVEEHGLVETNLDIDLEGLLGSSTKKGTGNGAIHAAAGSSLAPEDDPVCRATTQADTVPGVVEAVSAAAAGARANGAVSRPARQNGHPPRGLVDRGLSPTPEEDPAPQASPWAAPAGSVQMIQERADAGRADFSWLKGAGLGLVLGVALCLGLDMAGLRLPGRWVKPAPEPETTLQRAAAGESPENAQLPEPQKTHPAASPPQNSAEREKAAERWQALSGALELARNHQYNGAANALKGLTTNVPGDDSLVQICAQLLPYWRLQASLLAAGYVSQQHRDPAGMVQSLLTENKQLRDVVEQFRPALKADPASGDAQVLKADLQKLVAAKDQALKQASSLQAALTRAEATATSSEQQLRTLKDQLQAAEAKLADAQKQLRQTAAPLPPAPQEHSVLKVPADPAPRDPVAAHAAYARGLDLYHKQSYAEAEKSFAAAVGSDDEDARYHYLLGLCRWQLGQRDQAMVYFKQAAALEQQNKPSGAFVRPVLQEMPAEVLQKIEPLRQR